ncbi:EAL domain-containing protein [Massilia sp. S19_KUP03_FR1]|uniref:EAL domain-containing protein n=1 Tax=Massilia sp. S19_KUP03_FR1 TaxID=3025503 RepID=UPI002FCDC31E
MDRVSNKADVVAAALQLIGMPACACSAGGIVFAANPELAALFGMSLVGRALRDILQDGAAADMLRQCAAGLPFDPAEYAVRRADGTPFWARIRARPIDPHASAAGAIWIVEDISDERRVLTEVQAIMTNPSVSILFTKDRVIRRSNSGFARMFGYPEAAAVAMPARLLYHDDATYDRIGAAAYPALFQGQSFHGETAMVRSDGVCLWVQVIGYLVVPGEVDQGTVWIIEDRTRQKRDEEALKEALMQNQAILDNAVLGIAVVENGCTLHANARMSELFGYPAPAPGDPTPSVTVRSLYADDATWLVARDATARDFAAGRVHKAEYQLARRDGSRFWGRLSGRPFDPQHPRGRSVWMVDDVTERVEAADAVRRARDELEVRVLARTAELAGANALLEAEIAERRTAQARVHNMAYYDALTGLPNRALLADRLERAMAMARRGQRQLAVMFLDLDRFKNINDSLGHMTGDTLLKEVAQRLVGAVRSSDTVARLGGDEFVVVAPGVRGNGECAAVGDKIIAALAAPFLIEGRTLHISPSIGICLYPDDGVDVDTLMRHADAAMYAAKAAGRNNYQFFTAHMNQAAARHFELESSLRGALARGEFELFYQPLFKTATRRLAALEVLLRWRRPVHGLMLPDEFIPILEENGMIVPVGEWVMRRACEQSMAWQRAGLPAVPIAVNLSARQFMHRGLVDAMQAIVSDTGIDPALLECEITETALMEHGAQTLEILSQIAQMGVKLSIDDFGTGYSSLAYLKRFPVHTLKIDRAFVRDLETSSEDRAIVAAIVALSGSLQLAVVAEGVETEAQFALLREQGCQLVQGYLFSKPVDAAATQKLLERAGALNERSSKSALAHGRAMGPRLRAHDVGQVSVATTGV